MSGFNEVIDYDAAGGSSLRVTQVGSSGSATSVKIEDETTSANKLAIDASGQASTNPGLLTVSDVVSVAGSGTTSIAKAVDVASGASDLGVPSLAVRDDALSTLTPAEGDWVPTRVDSQGSLWVNVSNPINATTTTNQTTIGHGHKEVTTAGTDVVLAGSTTCKRVTIQAYAANTGKIAIGATGVDASATIGTGTGVILSAGESISFDITNLATVFIDATVNGEGVRYTYFN